MLSLLIATDNQGKIAEYRALLGSLPLELVTPRQRLLSVLVEENGDSYAENARIKAVTNMHASGLLTLADDSGLEVDALGGEPGLRSARYAGNGATDEDRYDLLLRRLESVPRRKRTARFRCLLVLAVPEGDIHTVEGTCEGLITLTPRGSKGFGYDPVFLLPKQNCTMAELPAEVKNQVSHRAAAVRAILPILTRYSSETGCAACPAVREAGAH